MKKCLLTSAGFENLAVKEAFLELVGKEPSQIKALWVPTAAGEEARAVLAKAWRICLTQESGLKILWYIRGADAACKAALL